MNLLLRRKGYRLYPPDSPEAGTLLAEQGLRRADLDRALVRLQRSQGLRIHTITGINEDGVFATSLDTSPTAPREPLIPVLWLQVHELLGRIPEGSTARFLEDGTLPE